MTFFRIICAKLYPIYWLHLYIWVEPLY